LTVNTKENWTNPAVLALAFNAAEQFVASGETTTNELAEAKSTLYQQATDKVTAANA